MDAGGPVQRAAAGEPRGRGDPHDRAAADRQATRPLRLLPGLRRGARVGGAEHPQPLVHDRRRGRHRDDRGARRAVLARRAVRRARPLHQGRQAQVRLQLGRRCSSRSSSPASRSRPGHVVFSAIVRARGRHDARRGHAHPARPREGSARPGSRPSRASSRSPARASTSAGTAASRSPTTTRASRRGRSSAARSTRRSSTSAATPFVDLAQEAAHGLRPRLTEEPG